MMIHTISFISNTSTYTSTVLKVKKVTNVNILEHYVILNMSWYACTVTLCANVQFYNKHLYIRENYTERSFYCKTIGRTNYRSCVRKWWVLALLAIDSSDEVLGSEEQEVRMFLMIMVANVDLRMHMMRY